MLQKELILKKRMHEKPAKVDIIGTLKILVLNMIRIIVMVVMV